MHLLFSVKHRSNPFKQKKSQNLHILRVSAVVLGEVADLDEVSALD